MAAILSKPKCLQVIERFHRKALGHFPNTPKRGLLRDLGGQDTLDVHMFTLGRKGGGHDGEDTEDALIGRGRMACGGPAPKL